jgi:hypothetical protein
MRKYTVLSALVALCCSCGDNPYRSNDALLTNFRQALRPVYTMTHGYQIVRLDSIATFAWDSVYYFTGESTDRYISTTIGFKWDGPDVPDALKRLLFVHKQQVVKFIDCRTYGSADPASDEAFLPIHFWPCNASARAVWSRKAARFAVWRYCDQPAVEFEFVAVQCLDNLRNLLDHGCPQPITRTLPDSTSNQ